MAIGNRCMDFVKHSCTQCGSLWMRGGPQHSTAQSRAEGNPTTSTDYHVRTPQPCTVYTVHHSNMDCRSPSEVMPSRPLHRMNQKENKHSCRLPHSAQWRHCDQRIGYSDNMVPGNTAHRANTCVWMKNLNHPPLSEPSHHNSRNSKASVCIPYRRRHFALSGHPLLYSCTVRVAPLYFIQMLAQHSPALVAWLHVCSRRQPIASFLLRIDADTGRGDPHLLLLVSAGIREGNPPPPQHTHPPAPPSFTERSLRLGSHSLTHTGIYIKGGDWLSAFNALTAVGGGKIYGAWGGEVARKNKENITLCIVQYLPKRLCEHHHTVKSLLFCFVFLNKNK